MLSTTATRALRQLEEVIATCPLKALGKTLAKLERDVEACKPALLALVKIRDSEEELWSESAESFAEYCQTWGIKAGWVNRLVVWMQVNEVSKPMGLEVSERQARGLNAKANRLASSNGTSKLEELQAAIQERKDEIELGEAQSRLDRSRAEKPVKDWREAAEAKLRGAMKAWVGRSAKVERKLSQAWACAMAEREGMKEAA